jgi:hypothetical protein
MKNWKIVACIGAGLLLLLALRWYGNAQWEKGVSYGDVRTEEKMAKTYEEKWKVVLKGIENDKKMLQVEVDKLATYKKELDVKGAELDKQRVILRGIAAAIVATSKAQQEAAYENAKNLTNTNVDDAIRKLSRELETDRINRLGSNTNSGNASSSPAIIK